MSRYLVARRLFTAKKYPKGSTEREAMNADWLTSEYMPSYKYGLRTADGGHTPFTYRTKSEADAAATTKGAQS